MARVHGGLAHVGKVRKATAKMEKLEKKRDKRGRCAKRIRYNRLFCTKMFFAPNGKRIGPNSAQLQEARRNALA
ncbi:ribosomal protein S30 [Kipferlia bialata]|uniref:40S ribosomal protein S30 n=1 Tax=Kipferlia bialata TaxID=797122 RepID=A0A9K3D861_9EUKA|nr:ribosomal protein S30 [Kipferlia bialata]|eukprot:g11927.t1